MSEEDVQYVLIRGVFLSEHSKQQIKEFFKERKHENGECLILELPKGCTVSIANVGEIITRVEIVETE